MERKLTTQERTDLQRRHRKTRDGRMLAYDDGYSYSEISRILLLDDETIRCHIKAYFTQKKLKPSNGVSSGAKRRLV